MEKIPFKAEHLFELDLQDGQAFMEKLLTPEQAKEVEELGWCYSAIEDGKIYGCAGVASMWQGRGMVWSYISRDAVGVNFLKLHRLVKGFLDGCYVQRLEMTVDCEFQQGHRWAQMLGFELEAPLMKAYRPDGGDCSLYARVL